MSLASPQGSYSQPATAPGASFSSPYGNGCNTELPVYSQAIHWLTAQLLEQKISVKLQKLNSEVVPELLGWVRGELLAVIKEDKRAWSADNLNAPEWVYFYALTLQGLLPCNRYGTGMHHWVFCLLNMLNKSASVDKPRKLKRAGSYGWPFSIWDFWGNGSLAPPLCLWEKPSIAPLAQPGINLFYLLMVLLQTMLLVWSPLF